MPLLVNDLIINLIPSDARCRKLSVISIYNITDRYTDNHYCIRTLFKFNKYVAWSSVDMENIKHCSIEVRTDCFRPLKARVSHVSSIKTASYPIRDPALGRLQIQTHLASVAEMGPLDVAEYHKLGVDGAHQYAVYWAFALL
jgi:hypothetical protein